MTNPSSALQLTGPISVTVSTPGNPSVVALQFTVANISFSSPVRLGRGTLLVPVSTGGTNLTSGPMTPVPDTPGWGFSGTESPEPGYAAFALLPSGDGTIAPGGSIAFALTGVTVAEVTGAATLPFSAERTSLGPWHTQAVIALNPPNTVPRILTAGPSPSTIVQNQTTVLTWTETGAAYCRVRDEDNDVVLGADLPAEGPLATLSNTPVQGNFEKMTATNGGAFYVRRYTVTAHSAGDGSSGQWTLPVTVGLPTIVSFAVTPRSSALGDQAVVSWSVANLDPVLGRMTMTIAPQDGTPAQQIAIPLGTPDSNDLFGGSAAVTPTLLATTNYTLTVDDGYGVTAMQTQPMTSPLAAGAVVMSGLPLPVFLQPDPFEPAFLSSVVKPLAAFGGKLWWGANRGPLLCTSDGAAWTQASRPPRMSYIWALLPADLGQGEVLCAFGWDGAFIGRGPLAAAWTRDGAAWQAMARPPAFGVPVATAAGILLCPSGLRNPGQQVWLSRTGDDWTQVGDGFPQEWWNAVASFDGKLYTVPTSYPGRWRDGSSPTTTTAWSSADGGATWQPQSQPIPSAVLTGCALRAAGDELWLFGAGGYGADLLRLGQESWTGRGSLLPGVVVEGDAQAVFTATHRGYLWFAYTNSSTRTSELCLFNQVLPGTVFALTAVHADAAGADAPAERP